jgi:hypothetical protein
MSRRPPEEESGPFNLRQVAETTGGSLLKPHPTGVGSGVTLLSPGELRVALDELHSQIIQLYRLEVQWPEAIDKMQDWKLEVVNSMHRGKLHLKLSYPRQLVPCEAMNGSPQGEMPSLKLDSSRQTFIGM